jgi:hypothetical protein
LSYEFYLSSNVVSHSRKAFQFIELLSTLGGLTASLSPFFTAIGSNINNRLLFEKMIRSLYFKKKMIRDRTSRGITIELFKGFTK